MKSPIQLIKLAHFFDNYARFSRGYQNIEQ